MDSSWPGSVSNKWFDTSSNRSRMLHSDGNFYCNDGPAYSILSTKGLSNYFQDFDATQKPNKKPAPPGTIFRSASYERKPRTLIKHPNRDLEPKRSGVKMIDDPFSLPPQKPMGRKYIGSKMSETRKEVRFNKIELSPSGEYTIEDIITRKRRILDVMTRRNGIPFKKPGDKYYSNPEDAVGYWKVENGVTTGATGLRGYHVKTIPRGTTGWKEFDVEVQRPFKALTAKEVEKINRLNEETASVTALFDWERNVLSENDPSYKFEDLNDDS